ncbi:DegT/DnrJ/EryC1/StrS family aminotransferase [candidate division KSB1 bacterium]|nr:DegT/DnrJ/EryC1/StrS family aminotransferase [candidate division KSB1 bacterium]
MSDHGNQAATLAIFGGPKTKSTPYGTGERFDAAELENLTAALKQNTLFYTSGQMTRRMLEKFKQNVGIEFANAVSSGTAAIHVALGASGVSYGDEVILPPITDTGTAIGILAQNAIPVFTDVDPDNCLMTPALVAKKITRHTKAIIVVHLTGNPCDMDGFVRLAKENHLVLIEDCAQAWGAKYHGQPVGTIGDFGCFSLNDFKHIGCGDGGIVCTRYEYLYRTAYAFADKYYDRLGTGYRTPSAWLGFNYRFTELQAAVALAQLDKLAGIVQRRHELGQKILQGLAGIAGIIPYKITPDSFPTYWFTSFRVDEAVARVTALDFAEALKAEGIDAGPGYFSLLRCDLFLKRQAYQGTTFPFDLPAGRHYEYHTEDCPAAELALNTMIRLPVHQFHTDADVAETIAAVRKVAGYYQKL